MTHWLPSDWRPTCSSPGQGPRGVRNEGRPQVWSTWAFCALATEREHLDVSLVTCCLGSNLETRVRRSTGYVGNSLERDSSVDRAVMYSPSRGPLLYNKTRRLGINTEMLKKKKKALNHFHNQQMRFSAEKHFLSYSEMEGAICRPGHWDRSSLQQIGKYHPEDSHAARLW